MAKKDLHHFLIAISRFTSLRSQYQANPGRVMDEAKLSKAEQALVRSGDAKKIREYLGDLAVAFKIEIAPKE